MFYSQRVSDRMRRLVNTNPADRAWRTLSVQLETTHDAPADEHPARKRSKTHATTTPAPFERSVFDFGVENAALREKEEKSANPIQDRSAKPAPVEEQTSSVLRFVQDLRKSLEDDAGEQHSPQAKQPSQSNPSPKADSRNDSVISNPVISRKRRHSFHATPTQKLDLSAIRADIVRMGKERKLSPAELSLLTEMYHQERYLTTHKCDGGSPAYQKMASTLTKNRDHLRKYRKGTTRREDLPASVRDRMAHLAEQMEGEDDVMTVAADDGEQGAITVEYVRRDRRRRMSEQSDSRIHDRLDS